MAPSKKSTKQKCPPPVSSAQKGPPSLLPAMKRKSKRIKTSTRQNFNTHASPNPNTIILHGTEFKDGQTYAAWLSYSGNSENKGYYTNPITKAWNYTTINENELIPLYTVPNSKSMTEIFCFDYWVKRRENPFSSEGKKADPAKDFPYMAFLYMRPSNTDGENVKGENKWSLTEWTNHLAKEITRFMTWTRKNPTVYDSFKFPTTIKIKTYHQTYPLANEFLDNAVVEVIRNLYDVPSVDNITNNQVLRDTFFGESVNMDLYNLRVTEAWLDHDEEEDFPENESEALMAIPLPP